MNPRNAFNHSQTNFQLLLNFVEISQQMTPVGIAHCQLCMMYILPLFLISSNSIIGSEAKSRKRKRKKDEEERGRRKEKRKDEEKEKDRRRKEKYMNFFSVVQLIRLNLDTKQNY